MGLFDLLFGESDDSSNNPLEKERQASITQAKDGLYQQCFSELTQNIPLQYKNNRRDCYVYVHYSSSVELDKDTIHKVLTKASYDAIKNVGLKTSEKPRVEYNYDIPAWQVCIRW